MKKFKTYIKWIFVPVAIGLLSACGYVDDFAFGKDNALKPSKLPSIVSKKQLDISWSANVGAFVKQTSIKDLQAYAYEHRIYTASSDGRVQALDEKTGKVLWTQSLHKSLVAGPLVYHNKVAVNTDKSSIIILDKKQGNVIKSISLSNDALAKPLLLDDHLYVKTINGILYDINIETGKKYWRYNHGAPEIILKSSSSPVSYNHMVLAGFSDGELLGFEQHSGHVVWQQHIAFPSGASDVERLVDIDTNPLVDGNRIYVATYQGQIGAYSIESSNSIWQRSASTFQDLAIEGQSLYMVDSNDIIWAIDKMTGNVLWKQSALKARGLTAPIIWNKQLWVGDHMGVLHGISLKTGNFIGQLSLSGSIISAPLIHDGSCFVYTTNGKLYRINMRK
jgi:outer membrane protein assembly factor BamB